ncbi:MAG: hypothetical protein J6K15_01930 [Lachnospiraceae bacterium]|nr:hypothetical protein [Lachnospiraceae bacterium]
MKSCIQAATFMGESLQWVQDFFANDYSYRGNSMRKKTENLAESDKISV